MRITIFLLLIGISISLATALAPSETVSKTSEKRTATDKIVSRTKTTDKSSTEKGAQKKTTTVAKTQTTPSPKPNAKASKSRTAEAATDIDMRGKRTLYDFGNADNLYEDIASRRAGYDRPGQSYYPQNGYYNGQDAVAQFPNNYIGHQYYPQYLEAPEPIIEIIIKDSNETIPEPEPQPIITKKKKEKVHVFYVNYKKDHNNKLHLESPIASLNNDDTDVEEEEEIVHYPVTAATAAPPIKTTTLRTIIHPDSEKYHSNSGIHVTFGTEDKTQDGHQIEEHDAESVQNQVVAIPVTGSGGDANINVVDGYNMRADFGVSQRQAHAGSYQQTHYQQQPQPQQQQQQQQQKQLQGQYQKQQLPLQQSGNYFRAPAALPQQQQTPHGFYQKQQQAQYQQHQYPQQQKQPQYQNLQQRPHFNNVNPAAPPATPSPAQSLPLLQQLSLFRKTFGASNTPQGNFFFNHNQQYQPQSSNQQQTFFNSLVPNVTPAPTKSSVFFPTEPPKSQELPAKQAAPPYQPVKFRPTLAPAQPHVKQVAIPVKLENTNYQQQQQQYQQQQYYKPQQQQPAKQQQSYQPFQFNRQPQFVKQPSFTVPSPHLGSTIVNTGSSTNNNNYFKQSPQMHSHTQLLSQKLASSRYQPQPQPQPQLQPQPKPQTLSQPTQFSQTQQHAQSHNYQRPNVKQTFQNQPSGPTAAALQAPNNPIKSLNNFYSADTSKETELLKSISKYEQHITETIQTPIGGFGNFAYQGAHQVLHDIPAPHLGPTSAPNQNQQIYQQQQQQQQRQQQQQQSYQQQQQKYEGKLGSAEHISGGHYITAAALQNQNQGQSQQQQQQQHQFSNFVTVHGNQNSAYTTTTPAAPPQYAQTTDGEKIMIVTPMPPNAFANQYPSNQYQLQASSKTQVLAGHPYVQEPRESSASSLISASVPSAASSATSSQFSVSNFHSDVFKELEQRRTNTVTTVNDKPYLRPAQSSGSSQVSQSSTTKSSSNDQEKSRVSAQAQADSKQNSKATQTLLQLPDEVPDDLRQQLLSSGILNNADISVLDYDKVGDVALENLPAEHLQHFYGAGGAAQISASKKVVTVVKPNGDKVALNQKDIERVKQSNALPHKNDVNVKVVHFDANNEKNISEKYIKSNATVVPPIDLAERQYNRYLPLKINGAQFPLPDNEELHGRKVVSVVVLAPVEAQPPTNNSTDSSTERRSERETSMEEKEVKFLGGDLIKALVKKPTKDNFKRWLEKEARTDVEQQSVILLVAKPNDDEEQEIFMYDISTGAVNKLNGELSSAFVSVAEENASSEDLEHASTLDPSVLETMMQKNRR